MTDQRFTELLSKKLSNEISAEDDREFLSLLSEHEDYRSEFESLNGYFQADEQPDEHTGMSFEKIKERISIPETGGTTVIPPVSSKRSLRMWYNIAAILAFCICTFTAYKFLLPKTNTDQQTFTGTWNKLTSSTGRQKSAVILPDGTRITLNAESELRYPTAFKGATREVYLTGEGFFDVAKDHRHPFIVHTQRMDIRVLGTAFDVKSYQNERFTETTLLRGKIQITLNSSPKTPILLSPSEKFVLTHSTGSTENPGNSVYSISSMTYFNPGNKNSVIETSWMDNKLAFKNESFDKISLLMARWYGVNLVFKSDEIRNYKFTGQFEKETLPEALKALQFIAAFRYEIKGKTIYLYH